MAKPNKPLLSLGARGTIGEALTFQKRGQDTIVRQKPIPRDPYSLKQAYQRWLYRDYAYMWTLLSNSEKQIYRTRASRYHITGFSQWMRENLKEQTDIAGMWHLDEKAGAIAYDSSVHANHGTIIGCSPTTGLIDGAQGFDGINDGISFPASALWQNLTTKSILLFISLAPFDGAWQNIYIGGYTAAPWGDYIVSLTTTNNLRIYLKNTVGVSITKTIPYTPDTIFHLAYSWDGALVHFYKDGIEFLPALAFTGILASNTATITLGNPGIGNTLEGIADHLIIYRRFVTEIEVKRHSERRYPA